MEWRRFETYLSNDPRNTKTTKTNMYIMY